MSEDVCDLKSIHFNEMKSACQLNSRWVMIIWNYQNFSINHSTSKFVYQADCLFTYTLMNYIAKSKTKELKFPKGQKKL